MKFRGATGWCTWARTERIGATGISLIAGQAILFSLANSKARKVASFRNGGFTMAKWYIT